MFGKDTKKKELITNLEEIYQKIEKEHQISRGDFPNVAKMQVCNGTCIFIESVYASMG